MLGGYVKLNLSTKELINALVETNGECVQINIIHLLYGPQKVRCNLDLINKENRLGFKTREQSIYIEKNKIVECGKKGNKYYFADDIMTIEVTKI